MPAVPTLSVKAKHRGIECGDTQMHTQRLGSCFALKVKGKYLSLWLIKRTSRKAWRGGAGGWKYSLEFSWLRQYTQLSFVLSSFNAAFPTYRDIYSRITRWIWSVSLDRIKRKRSALTFKGEAVMHILDFGFSLQENISYLLQNELE